MQELLPSFLLEPNILYLVLIVGAWVGVLALLIPGTGIIEVLVAGSLLVGLFGLVSVGASWLGLLLIFVAFGLYAAALYRQFKSAQEPEKAGALPVSPWHMILIGYAVQALAGLIIAIGLPDLSWFLVVMLALASLAIYRWMLLPTVSALRPPPQAGVEALIGARAEVRSVGASGRPDMVYLNGELWQAAADSPAAVGEMVEVMARDGMTLHVRKIAQE
jgi:membrane-bound serine protease (ClpP class)